MSKKTALAASILLATTAGLAGCSVTFGSSGELTSATLEEGIAERMVEMGAEAPDSIECSGSLSADAGSTTTCEVEHSGVRATLVVYAEDVDGDTLNYSWETEEGSQIVVVDSIMASIDEAFTAEYGESFADIQCPADEVLAIAGAVISCDAVTDGGEVGIVEVVVTSVDGLWVNFDWSFVS
ncbi:hypothetical protein GCM10009808_14690 [Microbacterium sediminicola]|uniref:DUF4333 domain-containing protein n=1 Tax=Microbacterium sediminicola TaxID=415210 RepID=A0ABP4U497_9MICO